MLMAFDVELAAKVLVAMISVPVEVLLHAGPTPAVNVLPAIVIDPVEALLIPLDVAPPPPEKVQPVQVIEPVEALLIPKVLELPEPPANMEALTVTTAVDALLNAVVLVVVPPVNVEFEILIAPDEALLNAKAATAFPPPIKLQAEISTAAVELLLIPWAPTIVPETARILDKFNVPLVAVTFTQAVDPARKSAVMARTVDMVKTPPPMVAPAAVLVAVVRVARAFAVPRFPAVPAPVD